MAESLQMQAFNVQAANNQAANVQAANNVQPANVQPPNVQAPANLDTFHVDLKIGSESKYYGYSVWFYKKRWALFF